MIGWTGRMVLFRLQNSGRIQAQKAQMQCSYVFIKHWYEQWIYISILYKHIIYMSTLINITLINTSLMIQFSFSLEFRLSLSHLANLHIYSDCTCGVEGNFLPLPTWFVHGRVTGHWMSLVYNFINSGHWKPVCTSLRQESLWTVRYIMANGGMSFCGLFVLSHFRMLILWLVVQ